MSNGFVDIAAEGYDAGVRLGETLAQDMLAVSIGPELRMAIVGSPIYLAQRGMPATLDDLSAHDCIGLRFPTHGGLAVWDLEKDGRALNVRIEPRLTVNDSRLQRQAALSGAGLAYVMEELVQPDLVAGSLVQVLHDWCPLFPATISTTPAGASARQPGGGDCGTSRQTVTCPRLSDTPADGREAPIFAIQR